MATRKSLSKKIRFEVFKRDHFTCQYCGRMSPDIVLEVDHIKPVSKGGTNDIMNLVTSCYECNRGKRDVELSDNSVIKKQQEQLAQLAEKNEQLDMMLKWRAGLKDITERQIEEFSKAFDELTGCSLNDTGKKNVRKWLRDYSLVELLDALDISVDQYFKDTPETANLAFLKITSIANFKKNPMDEQEKIVFYLRKILINRLNYVDKREAYTMLKTALECGASFDSLKMLCCTVQSWTRFKDTIIDEY